MVSGNNCRVAMLLRRKQNVKLWNDIMEADESAIR